MGKVGALRGVPP